MTLEVSGAGKLGFAFETTQNTFLAPTDWLPVRSESLQLIDDKIYRMNIRGAGGDRSTPLPGYKHVEGDIEFEVMADSYIKLMYAARVTPSKAGTTAPFTYTFAPTGIAKASTATGATTRKTLSVQVERSGVVFGYTGIAVTQQTYTVDNGMLIATFSLIGSDEASQSAGTPVWPTTLPYAPGKVTLEFPDATPRADVDTFTLTINDNGAAANRLNGTRNAAYIVWGEREVTASYDADFDNNTDYNVFKNNTNQALEVLASNNTTNDEVSIKLNNCFVDSYPVSLSGFGDIVRTSISMHSTVGAATDAYTIVAKGTVSIT